MWPTPSASFSRTPVLDRVPAVCELAVDMGHGLGAGALPRSGPKTVSHQAVVHSALISRFDPCHKRHAQCLLGFNQLPESSLAGSGASCARIHEVNVRRSVEP